MNDLHTYYYIGGYIMDTETLLTQMEQDFESLVEEHEAAASNERLWAKGANDSETARMHEENAEGHLLLVRMYRRMKSDTLAFVETYDDDADI
jgi:hypothetical protein